jgi:hypothetical protein
MNVRTNEEISEACHQDIKAPYVLVISFALLCENHVCCVWVMPLNRRVFTRPSKVTKRGKGVNGWRIFRMKSLSLSLPLVEVKH